MCGIDQCNVLLMKLPKAGDLPSISPGCIQVEAYLRLAKANFAVAELSTTGPSPTGCLPAVETPNGIAGRSDDRYDDLEAAASVIEFLEKRAKGLESDVPSHLHAESQAFVCLLESKLCTAVQFSTWCEWSTLSQLPDLYGRTLPWPLNYIIPYTQALSVSRKFRGQHIPKLYEGAINVIKALNNRAEVSDGPYILGKQPTILDAKAYGILVYILGAPTVAPVLKDEVKNSHALGKFIDYISQSHFAAAPPTLLESSEKGAWSAAAAGNIPQDDFTPPSADEKRARSNSKWWLGGVGLLVVGYVLFGGHYFGSVDVEDMLEGEDDEMEGIE